MYAVKGKTWGAGIVTLTHSLSRIVFHKVGPLYETEYLVNFKEYFLMLQLRLEKVLVYLGIVWRFYCFMKDFVNIFHFDSVHEV